MKIVIEVAPQLEGKRGIGVYTENLIKGLSKIDKENEYILFGWFFRNYNEKIKMLYCPEQENFQLIVKKFPELILNKLEWKLNIPIIDNFLKSNNINIYHSPGPRLPKLNKIKKVITVHDLIHEIYPQWVNHEFIKENREAVINADKIIANSENTKIDLIKYYNLPDKKIAVINLGINKSIFHVVEDKNFLESIKSRYSLPDKFILSVGPFNPHKNHQIIIQAYNLLLNKYKLHNYKLVFTGSKTYEYNLLLKTVHELNLIDKVIFTGYIPQNDLVGIYNLADILVCTSLYEGFGSYTMLEAMACGCPVIASNISSLPEAVDDAGILVNPLKSEEICEAIYTVLTDTQLREDLCKKGKRRIESISIEKTAQEVLKVYKELA